MFQNWIDVNPFIDVNLIYKADGSDNFESD